MADRAPVLVVGAGPVGLVLASELARCGVAVRVIDQLPTPSMTSKAVALQPRSLEMLAIMGVGERLIGEGERVTKAALYAGRKKLAEIDVDTVESRFPFVLFVPQDRTEAILAELLGDLRGRVERPLQCVGLVQDDDGVTATLRRTEGDDEQKRFSWVVGCDGAHSTVRQLVGTRLGRSSDRAWFLIADVDADHDFDATEVRLCLHPDGVFAYFPLPARRCRLVASLREPPGQRRVPTLDEVQAIARERCPGLRLHRSHWLTYFPVHHGQVPHYRFGRILLAGDAAHVHSPAGGQGMNTGMQDAFNLAWKLRLVWSGTAAPALLDSYERERHPIGAEVVRATTLLTRFGTGGGPVLATARRALAPLALGPQSVRRRVAAEITETAVAYRDSPIVGSVGRARGPVRPGDFAPDVDLGIANLGDVLTPAAHTALYIVGDPKDATAGVVARAVSDRHAGLVRSCLVVPDHPNDASGFDVVLLDPGNRVARRYGARTNRLVLVRPDGYVGLVANPLDAGAVTRHLDAVLTTGVASQ